MESWLTSLSPAERKLLLACAVLGQFDAQALAALFDDPAQVRGFLADLTRFPCIERLADFPNGRWQVQPALASPLLTVLRSEDAALYCTYRERAFTYFAQQLPAPGTANRNACEDVLMAHLDALFLILADAEELDALADLLTRAEQLHLQQHKHQNTLRYYRAVWLRQLSQYEQAQQILNKLLADERSELWLRARLFNALGILYDYRGRYDQALQAYGQSVGLYQQLGDLVGESKVRKNQGIVYHELAQYKKAQTLFERCRELAHQLGERELEARALMELGYTAKELGQWEGALIAYEAALALAQALNNQDLIARLHNNFGSLHCLLGHWSDAEHHYNMALALMHERRDVADILHNLGLLYFVQDRYEEASMKFHAGLKIAREIVDRDAISEFHYRLGCLHERQGSLSVAYQSYADALAEIETLRSQGIHEETRISILGSRQYIYQAMVLICLQLDRIPEALTHVEFAKSRAFLDRWGQAVAAGESHTERILSATEIQTQLASDALLIEFFATGHLGPGEIMLDRLPAETQHLRTYLAPPERLLAFAVTNTTLDVIPLAASLKQIEAQYFYRGDNRLRGTKPLPGQPLPPMHTWKHLATQLLDPLHTYTHGKRHLFFVPHSTLHYLPLHALAPASTPFVAPQTTLSYAPSATVLFKVCQQNTTKPVGLAPCLAIGVDGIGLSHAEAEATWVAHRHRLGGKTLLGCEATKEKVLAELGHANVVHFACHGLFRRLEPMQSALVLFDGELTAVDILQNERMHADLVTLSACDTGLNQLAHGDELMGLTRAFLMQGAQALVVTLWEVYDIATRLFMERFYDSWLGGATRAAALKTAQQYLRTLDCATVRQRLIDDLAPEDRVNLYLEMFQKMVPGDHPFDHPYYWGAFLLIGDPM